MRNRNKILLFLMLIAGLGLQRAVAAFVIEDGSKKSAKKYSLNNLHRPRSPFSLSSLGHNGVRLGNENLLTLPPVQPLPLNSVEIESPVLVQKGHTMYIYNYKYKVESRNPLPMFKAPSVWDYRTK